MQRSIDFYIPHFKTLELKLPQSQALFGDDSSNSPIPLKVNLKLTEKALLDSCQSTMTVVELNEWIPSEQFAMKKDNITGQVFSKRIEFTPQIHIRKFEEQT